MPLFTAEQLTRQLQYGPDDAISDEDAAQTEVIVAGWLADATELDEFPDVSPDPLPDPLREWAALKAWAIELGGIAFENPTSMERDQAGDISSGWRDRRSQILAQAKAWARRRGHLRRGPSSRGAFPRPEPFPDRAIPRRGW